MQKRLQ